MHSLLRRQLRKTFADAAVPISPAFSKLLESVSRTYDEADQDRYMLERSLEVSSKEMQALYESLRSTSQATIDDKHARLEESLAIAHAVQESVADGILVVDQNGAIVVFNKRFAAMWNLRETDCSPGTECRTLDAHLAAQLKVPRAYLEWTAELVTDADRVQHHDVELLDGRVFERYAGAMRGVDGARRGTIACYRDVTEPRRLVAQRVVVAERMAALGQLVAGVAHEINNPLSYIAGNVEYVRTELGATPFARSRDLLEALDDATEGVKRICVIVGDLCTLSRVEEESGAPTQIHDVIAVALQMANNQIRHRARVEMDLEPVPTVRANEARLTQVVLNLLVNAAHAIAEGRASENVITVATRLVRTDWVRIEVRDSGCGIDEAHLERIFDPFFTTKPVGSGTGLGLSICKGLITNMGGTITVESTVGRGSCFAVELPVAHVSSVPEATAPEVVAPVVCARRCVLVVDDDVHIRRFLRRALGSTYDVEAVASVDDALVALSQRLFDAVLCDVMMPDRTGLDLHSSVGAMHPAMSSKLVFMSGGAFTPTVQTFFEQVPNRLTKPLDLRRVLETIERVATAKAG